MEAPVRYKTSEKGVMAELLKNLKEALYALPHYFESPIVIQGLPATDLFSVNTLLGGAIEEQTVRILNNMRNVWDPDGAWFNYKFIRFPESFPDVRLVKSQQDESPAIGIELIQTPGIARKSITSRIKGV